ncbi:MAG: hypothetical protein OXG89_03745 [bacterium]|nr:hypothetical protein [bacterium]MYH55348.1 hypothetical protein [Acidimicrobiia bacterium]
MEVTTQIPITWLITAAGSGLVAVISFFTTIILVYRSIIKKIDDGFTEVRREIQAGDAALRKEINTLTRVVIGLAEKVGETRGRPEEVPTPVERIAEAG